MNEVQKYIIERLEEEIEQFKEETEINPYNVKMIVSFTEDLLKEIKKPKMTTTTKGKTGTTNVKKK